MSLPLCAGECGRALVQSRSASHPIAASTLRRLLVSNHVYSITEIVGSSDQSVEDAIQNGIRTAAKTLRNLEWFEVTQIKGHVVDGGVGHYQVCMKLGLRYEQK